MSAYDQGRIDAIRGKRNPFEEGTPEWCDWEEGAESVAFRFKRKRKDKWESFDTCA